jgi:hypothetical protein
MEVGGVRITSKLRRRMKETCSLLVGKPKGKRQLRRSRRRWKDNIKMHLKIIVQGV